MQDRERELACKYNLEVKSSVPYKDGYLLNTQRGKIFLKKSLLSAERILFIYGAKEHLYNNGFKNLDRYLCNEEGLPYSSIDGFNYTACEVIEGAECNFDNTDDVIKASIMLGSLHKSSKGYVPPEGSKSRDDLGKLPCFFGKRLEEIKKLKKVAKKGKTKFDYMFLEHFDHFNCLGEDAINMLLSSQYEQIAGNSRKQGVFCHHDFTHHNILQSSGKFFLINFDYCCFELKVYDLANLIRRKMRKCGWDIKEAKIIVDSYRSIEKISGEELLVMKIMLQFPQKFWRVVNKYYNSKRSWSEKSFVFKMQEVIDEIECHKKFLENYEVLC